MRSFSYCACSRQSRENAARHMHLSTCISRLRDVSCCCVDVLPDYLLSRRMASPNCNSCLACKSFTKVKLKFVATTMCALQDSIACECVATAIQPRH